MLRTLTIVGAFTVTFTGLFTARFAAGAPNKFVDAESSQISQLVDEFEAYARTVTFDDVKWFAALPLMRAAEFRIALNQPARAIAIVDVLEKYALSMKSPEGRVVALSSIAEILAPIDRSRALKVIELAEPLTAELPLTEYSSGPLTNGYLAVSDFRKAIDHEKAELADETPSMQLQFASSIAVRLARDRQTAALREVQDYLRNVQNDPLTPPGFYDEYFIAEKISAFAKARLPDDARRLLPGYLKQTTEHHRAAYLVIDVAASLREAGRRAESLELLRTSATNLPVEHHVKFAVTAARAGDFGLAREYVNSGNDVANYWVLERVAVWAHRAGEKALRDEMLERYGAALLIAAEKRKGEDMLDVEWNLAVANAAVGQLDDLQALIKRQPPDSAARSREFLIAILLRERGKTINVGQFDLCDDILLDITR